MYNKPHNTEVGELRQPSTDLIFFTKEELDKIFSFDSPSSEAMSLLTFRRLYGYDKTPEDEQQELSFSSLRWFRANEFLKREGIR